MSELSDAVESVIRAATEQLQDSDIDAVAGTPENVASLLAAGEIVIAYEILCENLYEDDIVVARELLWSLRAAAHRAGADVSVIDSLLS